MTGPLYVAWRYIAYHRAKLLILVLALTTIVYLPVGLNVLVTRSAEELTARARTTPLLLGSKGSPLELVLSSLYFSDTDVEPTRHAEVTRVAESGLAEAIPLHARFEARDHPIIGTSLAYFELRGLHPARGRLMAVLGECVLGARTARDLELGPGDTIVSSPRTAFDLAGVYPLEMSVAGVLAPSGTPDDTAIFTDIKTTWVIEGLGHGHQDLSTPAAAAGVLKRDENTITANAAVREFNRIAPDNAASFHFHGDVSSYPVTGIIAAPHDEKASAILMGRYLGQEESQQIVRPRLVIEELLATVFEVQAYVSAAIVLVALATAATAALVLLLSLRLRRREIATLEKIGASRPAIRVIVACEIAFVLTASTLAATALTAATRHIDTQALVRALGG
ncbi:MAG: ABC transporter permease [Candidatus Binatia bacterium]